MNRLKKSIKVLERKQQFLENKLKTSSLFYGGRSYDEAENNALKYVLEVLKEKEEVEHHD